MECEIEQTTQVKQAKLVTWQSQQATRRMRLSSKPMSGWQSMLCLRVIWSCCWPNKRHDLDTDGLNAALPLESSKTWVGTMVLTQELLHDWVLGVLSCRFISKIPNSLTLSALILFVFHRLRRGTRSIKSSFWWGMKRTSSKRTFNTSWRCL